jgi:hypothetical protein
MASTQIENWSVDSAIQNVIIGSNLVTLRPLNRLVVDSIPTVSTISFQQLTAPVNEVAKPLWGQPVGLQLLSRWACPFGSSSQPDLYGQL